MKKLCAIGILLSILLSITGCQKAESLDANSTASFAPPTSSSSVPEPPAHTSTIQLTDEEIEKYSDGTEDYILRIYAGEHIEWLGAGGTLEELLSEFWQYYVVIDGNEITYKSDDVYNFQNEPLDVDNLCRYIVHPEHVFGATVEVYDIFCIDGGRYEGDSVFFFTDQGEFVLYREYSNDDELFLMSWEEYYELAHEHYQEIQCICGEFSGREQYPFTPFLADPEDAAKVEEGMTYAEVVELLNVVETHIIAWIDGGFHCYWDLDNGNSLWILFGGLEKKATMEVCAVSVDPDTYPPPYADV